MEFKGKALIKFIFIFFKSIHLIFYIKTSQSHQFYKILKEFIFFIKIFKSHEIPIITIRNSPMPTLSKIRSLHLRMQKRCSISVPTK